MEYSMLGPIDYLAVGFKGNKFNGEIIKELQKVVDSRLVRIIDLLFIMKSENGEVSIIELENMPDDVKSVFNLEADSIEGLLSEDDALKVAEQLDKNSSAGILVFEHLWAKGFKEALMNANGILLAEGRVQQSDLIAVKEEIGEK
jgi:hypothetical protein